MSGSVNANPKAPIGLPSAERRGPRGSVRSDASLSEFAYRTVYDLILSRQLPGGEVIVEGRLAERLNVSRTPLREALGRLEGEGLLVKQASRSFSVRSVTAREFFESLKVREVLESEAAELAVGRISMDRLAETRRMVVQAGRDPVQGRSHWQTDNRLHALFAEASGNAVLAETIGRLRITTQLFEIRRPLERVDADCTEHLAILNELAGNDRRMARRAVLQHLKNLQADVMALLSGA